MKKWGYDKEDFAFEDFISEMRLFQCGDGMCGQLDCSKCYPSLLDKTREEVIEEEIN
jgi:hypothetical protein